jgi:ubiquinone/menaquinone biosynthesis C-methylase UbiE
LYQFIAWHEDGEENSMTQSQETIVEQQFGPQADAYVRSPVHAAGEDLDALEAIVRRHAPSHALDLGAGGGHVAYRLALHAGAVTASDLSTEMMAAVAATARERRLTNIRTQAAPAEQLPFTDAMFDFLACRFSTHHWRDMEAGLREARRVLRAGCPAVFIDVVSPGAPALDTHLQAVELLRDPSHVRDYSAAEWQAALGRAGFAVRAIRTFRLRMDYPSWVERMRTSPAHREAIRSLQEAASAAVSAHFAIEPDGSFTLDTALFEAAAV